MSDGSLSQRADVIDDEEGSGEDLFGDNHADDYRDMGVLDQYDSQMLDDRDVGEDDPDARIRAERVLAERDRMDDRRRGRRLGAAEESEEDEEYEREQGGGDKREAVSEISAVAPTAPSAFEAFWTPCDVRAMCVRLCVRALVCVLKLIVERLRCHSRAPQHHRMLTKAKAAHAHVGASRSGGARSRTA